MDLDPSFPAPFAGFVTIARNGAVRHVVTNMGDEDATYQGHVIAPGQALSIPQDASA